MTNAEANNKRIAKNTGLLYIRMFVIMAVSLFTSRVVLRTLGVEDFGIYNVVGGIVAMMGMFNQSLTAATQRYLSFGIGKGDALHLNKVFSVSINVYGLLCLIFVILAETGGLWFLNHKMIIPADRMFAANVVYQFSILTVMATMMMNVYNAVIISHEQMKFYAYISIAEVSLKLGIVYILIAIGFDKLIIYSILMFAVSLLICLIYIFYCRKYFKETKYRFYSESRLFKELIAFSGWNLFGAISGLIKTQGLNVLLNVFFTPVVNAARAIAVQVNSAVSRFFEGFFTAVKPQITILFAKGEYEEFFKLLTRSSKFSFFLILFLSLPILVEAPFIINIWLGELPEYTVSFTRLIILITAVDALAQPLMTAAQSTGRIKLYQTLVGTMVMMNLPISYLFLKLGFSPDVVFVISLIISVICLFIRVWVVKYLIPSFNSMAYINKAILQSLLVSLLAALPPIVMKYFWHSTGLSSLVTCLLCLLTSLVSVYIIGLTAGERCYVKSIIVKKILRRN